MKEMTNSLAAKTVELLSQDKYRAQPLDTSLLYFMAQALLGQPTMSFPRPVTEADLRHDLAVIGRALNDDAIVALAA